MIIKEYETVDKFVAPRIKWLQYGFRDGLVKKNHVKLYDFSDDCKEVIEERVYCLFNLYFGGKKEEDGGIEYSYSYEVS